MDFRPARVRLGEALAGAGAVALLVLMLAVHWYGARGATRPLTGWQALTHLRWLALVVIVAALALTFLQAVCRGPALPAAMSVIVTVLGLVTAVWMIYRVLIQAPAGENVVAVVGPICACLIVLGGFLSLRQEGILPSDGPQEIPIVPLSASKGGQKAPD
jgi:hypothetical protein